MAFTPVRPGGKVEQFLLEKSPKKFKKTKQTNQKAASEVLVVPL